VILVWILIPLLGIEGYAAVIILMELFNFVLSYARLKRRVGMRIDILDSLILPTASATVGALAASELFVNGSSFIPWVFALKILFVISLYIGILMLLKSSLGVVRSAGKKKNSV
jgi:ABC-type transport system involved in cytochrome bd biosynthesis fused ATPase/permease subunit